MTRDVAIEIIKDRIREEGRYLGKDECYKELVDKRIKALQMAISALEQDTVSEEVYTAEYNRRKDAEFELWKIKHGEPCEDAVSREPCRTCKYGECYNDAWCRCTYPKISGCRVKIKNGCEVRESYGIDPLECWG